MPDVQLVLSDHCIRRYRERIRPDLSFDEAARELLRGMEKAQVAVYKGSSGFHWEFPDCIVIGKPSSGKGMRYFTAVTCYEKPGNGTRKAPASLLGRAHALLSRSLEIPQALEEVCTAYETALTILGEIDGAFSEANRTSFAEDDRTALIELRYAIINRMKGLAATRQTLSAQVEGETREAIARALKAAFKMRCAPSIATLDAFDAEIEKLKGLSASWAQDLNQIELDATTTPE